MLTIHILQKNIYHPFHCVVHNFFFPGSLGTHY